MAKASSIEILKTAYRTPKMNSICERFWGSVRRECLDHWFIFSERQLSRVLKEYVRYFNQYRPHQGLNQAIPLETLKSVQLDHKVQKDQLENGKIMVLPVLGGLHHTYQRAA